MVTLNIETVLYLTTLAILNEVLRHYCTVRILGDRSECILEKSVKITRFT